jgi:hypothetical protein
MGDDVVREGFHYPEHKRNFDVSSDISLMKGLPDERSSLETSKFCLYFSGIVVSLSHRSWLLSSLTTLTSTV